MPHQLEDCAFNLPTSGAYVVERAASHFANVKNMLALYLCANNSNCMLTVSTARCETPGNMMFGSTVVRMLDF